MRSAKDFLFSIRRFLAMLSLDGLNFTLRFLATYVDFKFGTVVG